MDGNGRWATRRGKRRSQGHFYGVRATRDIVRAAAEQSIRCLSLFAFSSENKYRPQAETSALFKLFIESLSQHLDEVAENNIGIRFIGDLSFFPTELRHQIQHAEQRTADCQHMRLNVAINYSGRWDIAQAAQKLFSRRMPGSKLSAAQIETEIEQLLLIPEVDLLIRTGGERRISNFMLWQSAYSEVFFTDSLWPDFKPADLLSILHWYQQRERRFGRLHANI